MICLIDISDFDEQFFQKIRNAENMNPAYGIDRKAANSSLAGRVLLGYMLRKKYGLDGFRILYGENGKPYLENENIFFNISHSEKYVLCCIDESEIGCDLQILTPYNDGIARRFFTANEYKLLTNAANKDGVFTKIWTMKESILKKEGSGISGGLLTYDFSLFADENFFEAYGYKFFCFDMGDAQLCVCSENLKGKIERLTKADFENYSDAL